MTARGSTQDATLPDGVVERRRAARRVRHFLADLRALEATYPGTYPRVIVRGEGPYLFDDEGRRLLDAGNHLGAGIVGHGRTEIADRMAQQAATLEFAALDSGASHDRVIELAGRLTELVPVDDPIFSFTSSGSEANELAFKIARAYHVRRGQPQRTKILYRDGSYHGSTVAGMAATGAAPFKTGFGPLAPEFVQVPQPSPGRCGLCDRESGCTLACADAVEEIIEREGPETVAALIAEPVAILQAVKVPVARYWERVQEICRAAGVLLIIDEVVTGFGRTGRMFASDTWGIRPDLMTMAKGLTSGYQPMGATVASGEVEAAFADAPLLHLNTYAGHPVACAAALATLDILERERLPEHAAELEPVLAAGLEGVAAAAGERTLRTTAIGLLSSIELDVADRDDGPDLVVALRHRMYEEGLIARCALSDGVLTVVFYPTLVISAEDVERGTAILRDAIAELFT